MHAQIIYFVRLVSRTPKLDVSEKSRLLLIQLKQAKRPAEVNFEFMLYRKFNFSEVKMRGTITSIQNIHYGNIGNYNFTKRHCFYMVRKARNCIPHIKIAYFQRTNLNQSRFKQNLHTHQRWIQWSHRINVITTSPHTKFKVLKICQFHIFHVH